jgi:2-epi-valiolone-7-phosphate 1-reductase
MNSHRALTRSRKYGVDLSIASTPVCGPDDVMVSPRFVGLCGADIQTYSGAFSVTASVLGHEGVGVITTVGESVSSWSRGDAVVFNPVNPMDQDDVLGHSFGGLFQEQFLIERAESVNWLIRRIPAELLNPIGALIEPIATAIYSSELVAGQGDTRRAVVVGDGPIALLNSIVLRLRGFESVLMIHGRSTRGRWAVDHGYFERRDVISSRGDVAVNVAERFNGGFADVAVICTPGEAVEPSVLAALEYLKPGGLINFVSCAIPSIISLSSGDLDVRKLQRRNHSGLPVLDTLKASNPRVERS